MSQLEIQERQGVGPTPISALDPRQERFIGYYLDTTSPYFANCFQSAVKAGYTVETARNFMHNRPKWYSEIIGQMQGVQPEHLLLKLTDIINSPLETTQNKLKAIDMLMKHNGMYQTSNTVQLNTINIQSVLD
jgi:phage terminase small subunit